MTLTSSDGIVNQKLLVQRGYDLCAEAYNATRSSEAVEGLNILTNRLPVRASVLDIGCGGGIPITHALAKEHIVTGVDLSWEMLRHAQRNVPQATFIHGDIMSTNFAPSSFDAVVAFYSIFHIPREEHLELFHHIRTWLKPGGYLLATLTRFSEDAYISDDFFGVPMCWSNYGFDDYKKMLVGTGFTLVESFLVGHGYSETSQEPPEYHPLILAQKVDERRK